MQILDVLYEDVRFVNARYIDMSSVSRIITTHPKIAMLRPAPKPSENPPKSLLLRQPHSCSQMHVVLLYQPPSFAVHNYHHMLSLFSANHCVPRPR